MDHPTEINWDLQQQFNEDKHISNRIAVVTEKLAELEQIEEPTVNDRIRYNSLSAELSDLELMQRFNNIQPKRTL